MALNLQTRDTRNEAERKTDRALLEAQFNSSESLRAEFDGSFDRYSAYCKAIASGRAKVIRGARNGQ